APRTDESYCWNQCRTMTIPDSLQRKIDLFRAKARVFREGFDLFATTSWVAVILGTHSIPREHEPAADALDEERVAAALEEMRIGYLETAQAMPTQAEFIARAC